MFNINLEKELIGSKVASLSKEEKISKHSSPEDIKLLEKMGLTHAVKASKGLQTKLQFMKAFDKTRVFSTEEIKSLCITYGLRFLPISKFKGEIDQELPAKVNEFEEIYNKIIFGDDTNHRYDERNFTHNKFMVCAPASSFNLSERDRDPLLFYPIGNGDYFLVHKWGGDISAWNAIKSWRHRSFWHWYTYVTLFYYLPVTVLATTLLGSTMGIFGILGIASSASLVMGGFLQVFADVDFFSGKFNNEHWNSQFRD